MSIFYVLTLLFIGYILGIVFCNRPFSLLVKFFKNLTFYWKKFINFFYSWNDWLFIGFVVLLVVSFIYFGKNLKTEDKIQTLIVIGTFSSVVFATLVKDFASKYRSRPRIKVEFNDEDSNYYHMTLMRYGLEDKTGKKVSIEYFPSYYIRLNVKNVGEKTMNNVEVVLEDVEPRPEKFMSLNLSWAGFIVPTTTPGDIQRIVRIPQKQSRVVDVIEVTEPNQTKAFYDRLKQEGEWNEEGLRRLEKLVSGFRSCTIKPNTLSDIFLADKYIFHLGIYADDTQPKFIKLNIDYSGIWGTEGIKGMRSKQLKVELLD